jgi:exodeoxyribonuclease-3
MRLVAWNCNMALHRKIDALLALRPDVAVISECAEPLRLRETSKSSWIETEPVWFGRNADKGLGVFAFNGYSVEYGQQTLPSLRYILPVRVTGRLRFNLLAVWAQNASAGVTRKRQVGPLRRSLTQYRAFLAEGPSVIAGDWNSNAIWDKPGWRINHMIKVDMLANMGLVSAYHALSEEAHGQETTPTHYWRDRRKDGPTYHIDFIFMPAAWLPRVTEFHVGSFEEWCGNGLSDHAPLTMEIQV